MVVGTSSHLLLYTHTTSLLLTNFKVPLSPNGMLQIKQVNRFKTALNPNDSLQIKKLYALSFSWTDLTCLFRFVSNPTDFLQVLQSFFNYFKWHFWNVVVEQSGLARRKVDIRSTEWRVDRKKNDDWPKKILIKFLYIL